MKAGSSAAGLSPAGRSTPMTPANHGGLEQEPGQGYEVDER
jgi:hypothetical protein